MDGVVDAVVQRRPAAGHAVVGGVDDRAHCQGGDVAAPQAQPRIKRGRGGGPDGGDARLGDESLQQLVLGSQQIVVDGPRLTYGDESAEREPQPLGRHVVDLVRAGNEFHQLLCHEAAVVQALLPQTLDEAEKQVTLTLDIHGTSRLSDAAIVRAPASG